MNKTCTKCKIPKPIEEFYKQKNGKYGVTGKCSSCLNEYYKNRWKNEKDKVKENIKRYFTKNPDAKRNALIKYIYGLSPLEYQNLLIKQNYSCAICKKPETDFKRKLDIDHCHKTNIIRGILCPKCNQALGSFKDNVEILQNAINYLNNAYIKSV